MHGLVNRSIQCFLRDTYGEERWLSVAQEAGIAPEGFEALLVYDDALTDVVLDAAARQLVKPREALLEDLGIYLAGLEPLRRLLRFGGVEYADFLQSLGELPDRVHLAVHDLDMPTLELKRLEPGHFVLSCIDARPGFGAVFAGVLRAMADDYGALVLIEAGGGGDEPETVGIELLEARFATGRSFDLARPEGA